MELTPLNIQMLGGFSIRQGDTELSIGGRPQKLCLLLSYLIWERSRPVSCGELIGLIWKDKPQHANSLNALKAILHRARISVRPVPPPSWSRQILAR